MLGDTTEKASIQTPAVNACQLKALAIFADFLNDRHTPNLPNANTIDQTHLNGKYKAIQLKDLNDFYNKLNHTIQTQYENYIYKLRDHRREKFTLSDAESTSLLRYYDKKNEQPNNTLSYEWRRLTLQALLAEKNKIQALKNAGQTIPAGVEKRLKEIDLKLAEQIDIMGERTILQPHHIDLSIPEPAPYASRNLDHKCRREVERWREDYDNINYLDKACSTIADRAMMKLSSNISEADMILNFKTYLQIAFLNDAYGVVVSSIDPEQTDFATILLAIQKNEENPPDITQLDLLIKFNDQFYYANQETKQIQKIPPEHHSTFKYISKGYSTGTIYIKAQ